MNSDACVRLVRAVCWIWYATVIVALFSDLKGSAKNGNIKWQFIEWSVIIALVTLVAYLVCWGLVKRIPKLLLIQKAIAPMAMLGAVAGGVWCILTIAPIVMKALKIGE